MKGRIITGALLAGLLGVQTLAADSDVRAFSELLAGRFDSLAHKQEDQAAGMTEEQAHGWVTRTFTPIAAPAIAGPAVVATVVYNGPDGMFDEGEFQLWTLSPGEEAGTVLMTPRSFRDPDAYRGVALDASAFAAVSPEDLAPPHGAAGCPIVWRRDGDAWSGYTDAATCVSLSTQMKIDLGWEWNFRLTDEAMWIDFAGYDADGGMVYGRDDRVPWRLDRQS